MREISVVIFLSFHIVYSFAQSYTSYHIGKTEDKETVPLGGVCMMGGGRESDEAMKWFLNRANGGDVLVLRASGSDGYNSYMYSELGIDINSVESIVFHSDSAATSPHIHEKIKNAEAIWFAGGNQWKYVEYWRDSPISQLINDALSNRNIVIGGTSAGMAILGEYYFAASNGTVTSEEALSNPFDEKVDIDGTPFIELEWMKNVITDTHYDNRNRRGRHAVFLSRILNDHGVKAKGIACNERTAVCIDSDGKAIIYGDSKNPQSLAYFIQVNCDSESCRPERCRPNESLHWDSNQSALKVYKIQGTEDGNHRFDLTNWNNGNGGSWEYWYVIDGILKTKAISSTRNNSNQ